jgi:hypothetical protein
MSRHSSADFRNKVFALFASASVMHKKRQIDTQCMISPNMPRLINPRRDGVRLIWRDHAVPSNPAEKEAPFKAWYAINTKFDGITVNAFISITKAQRSATQPLPYAVNYHVTLIPHTGQDIKVWPHLAFYFIKHPIGDSDIVYAKGSTDCRQVVYTDMPTIQISGVYAFSI